MNGIMRRPQGKSPDIKRRGVAPDSARQIKVRIGSARREYVACLAAEAHQRKRSIVAAILKAFFSKEPWRRPGWGALVGRSSSEAHKVQAMFRVGDELVKRLVDTQRECQCSGTALVCAAIDWAKMKGWSLSRAPQQAAAPTLGSIRYVDVHRPRGNRAILGGEHRKRRAPNFEARDARIRDLGRWGEMLVKAAEVARLRKAGRNDLANQVQMVDPDAGYDMRSFSLDGSPRYIEVKTTVGPAETSFFISAK
jgi:hypothetical protein